MENASAPSWRRCDGRCAPFAWRSVAPPSTRLC
jgi:hypothetical protein